jgi:hypothetical protein
MDSYFGGTDFIGQEVVYFEGEPCWAMNYYGYILLPNLIQAAEAGHIIKVSLSALYKEERFLGGFEYAVDDSIYTDTNEGMYLVLLEKNGLPGRGKKDTNWSIMGD